MAGEQRGELFECLIFIALVDIGYSPSNNLFWGIKPSGFSIDPDFVLGSLETPTHWMLATSSGSAKNSLEKFWRNVGELFEVKRSFANPPKVVNLVLQSNLRDALQLAMSSIVDSEIIVDRKEYGMALQSLLDRTPSRLSSREEKLEFLRTSFKTDDKARRAFIAFKNDLKSTLAKRNPNLNSLWTSLRSEKRKPRYREARSTFVRRGIAKLMILPKDRQQAIYEHIRTGKKIKHLPEYYLKLGYASRTIAGAVVIDPDIRWVVGNLPPEEIDLVLSESLQARSANWGNWIGILRDTRISDQQDYVEKHYSELSRSEGMLKHLVKHSPSGYKWLFAYLMEVFKTVSGKRQGYGYSVLSRDVGYSKGISQGYLELSDWVNGFLDAPRDKDLIPDVAKALSLRLKQVSPKELKKMGAEIEVSFYRNLMETKVISYWLFEPLPILIRNALSRANVTVNYVKKHPTFIGEYLAKPTSIASPQVFRANGHLIVWRSAYDLGRHHKVKELCGRCQALRFSFISQGKFVKRTDVKKVVLVVDGTFTTEQLRSLSDSGWDDIFYPDEMNRLVSEVR
jgi:hypothetical protein